MRERVKRYVCGLSDTELTDSGTMFYDQSDKNTNEDVIGDGEDIGGMSSITNASRMIAARTIRSS